MLVQVVALLGLGVLGSSAQLQEEHSRTLVGLIIRELLQDMKKLNLSAVPSLVTVNATVERCMHSHLKTFVSTLTALDIHSKFIARKLTRLNTYKNILPKDLDQECETAQVTWDDFLDTLDRFLRLLSEKIQNA
ncbi:hypothetical protein HGM15179_005026 [Zosterops borbonicus]|uniref:Interleukin-4 n=1 Tax=Zosterops borbonicus TaxID=364589 RepID=A0A8K1GP54_9PASS|nr:hypothetical protein HGM15179_005026 [Zosterops borbonicus]